jgi:hypothetical protein
VRVALLVFRRSAFRFAAHAKAADLAEQDIIALDQPLGV